MLLGCFKVRKVFRMSVWVDTKALGSHPWARWEFFLLEL